MRKQALGKYEVSIIGMGTAEFGGRHPEGLARDLLDAYVSLGGNLVDTARVYGDFATPRNGESEKIVGRWMEDRGNRREIFLSTKGGHPPFHDMHRSRLSPEEIRGDMAASLEDLRTGYVDIYFLHRDDPSRPVGGIMETLHGLVEDGYTPKTVKRKSASPWIFPVRSQVPCAFPLLPSFQMRKSLFRKRPASLRCAAPCRCARMSPAGISGKGTWFPSRCPQAAWKAAPYPSACAPLPPGTGTSP